MKKPRSLHPGDKVAIVSLSAGTLGDSRFIHKYDIAKKRMEEDYGLQVVPMPNALKGIDYLYRHPEARAADLMEAFQNPEIKAVFCAIGGDDTIRLLPYIDFDVLRNNPKIFTGFSDTTTNHFMMAKAGIVSYYGLNVLCDWSEYIAINEYSRPFIDQMLFHPTETLDIPASTFCSFEPDVVRWSEANQNTPRKRYPNSGYEILQGKGKVQGKLFGGCVDVFPELLGTSLWPSLDEWRDKLLLLETSEEDMPAEHLIWFLRNLQAQGILHAVNGIVMGKPGYPDKLEAYKAALRQVVSFEADLPELPILYNVNVGHAYPIALFPLNLTYEIDCDKQTLTLLEPATIY